MPVAMERRLSAEADKRGYTGDRRDRYIYGTMRKTGWKPQREKHKRTIREDLESAMRKYNGCSG